jgi:hypothetical protein
MTDDELAKRIKTPGPVIRLRLQRKNNKWSIIKRISLPEKTVPRSFELPEPGRSGMLTGFWFEALDNTGATVYRQLLRKPIGAVEVFNRDGSITRVQGKGDTYTIDVFVPDWPEIEKVHLFHIRERDLTAAETKERPQEMRPVAEFSLREEKPARQTKKRGGSDHGDR